MAHVCPVYLTAKDLAQTSLANPFPLKSTLKVIDNNGHKHKKHFYEPPSDAN